MTALTAHDLDHFDEGDIVEDGDGEPWQLIDGLWTALNQRGLTRTASDLIDQRGPITQPKETL